ncbi:MAG: hypothetical protein QGH27_10785, partial [SAR324 cluster bacterium]|nr:hypothetical protein [SAR324 cluster bacterium]
FEPILFRFAIRPVDQLQQSGFFLLSLFRFSDKGKMQDFVSLLVGCQASIIFYQFTTFSSKDILKHIAVF